MEPKWTRSFRVTVSPTYLGEMLSSYSTQSSTCLIVMHTQCTSLRVLLQVQEDLHSQQWKQVSTVFLNISLVCRRTKLEESSKRKISLQNCARSWRTATSRIESLFLLWRQSRCCSLLTIFRTRKSKRTFLRSIASLLQSATSQRTSWNWWSLLVCSLACSIHQTTNCARRLLEPFYSFSIISHFIMLVYYPVLLLFSFDLNIFWLW